MTSDQNQAANGRLLATLGLEGRWGLVLITDDDSSEPIPSWASDEEQVTTASSSMVVRVMHPDDGDVLIRVWDGEGDFSGGQAFSGAIQVPSARLRISDPLGQGAVIVRLAAGTHTVALYTNSSVEASEVNLIIDPVG